MRLTATVDSASVIDGRIVRLKQGEAYNGPNKEAERLLALGLVAEEPARKKKGSSDD